MKTHPASGAERSRSRRGNRALHLGFQIGIVGMFLTILIATRLMTVHPGGYILQQAKHEVQRQKLVQRLDKEGNTHAVLKIQDRKTEVNLGVVEGNVVNWDANRQGEVAFSVEDCETIHSYVITQGRRTAIRVPGAKVVRIKKINERGDVIGMFARSDAQWNQLVWRAFLLSRGRLIELETFGGAHCFVNDLSQDGYVVGKAETKEGYYHAFLWREGQPMQDLGILPRGQNSEALSLNEKGEIVGSADGGEGNRQAVLWRNGVIFNLNRQTFVRNGWDLQEGREINAEGEITVYGVKERLVDCFLLKARTATVSSVNGSSVHRQ
jgi:probable HAF family extracellular repeat protein